MDKSEIKVPAKQLELVNRTKLDLKTITNVFLSYTHTCKYYTAELDITKLPLGPLIRLLNYKRPTRTFFSLRMTTFDNRSI